MFNVSHINNITETSDNGTSTHSTGHGGHNFNSFKVEMINNFGTVCMDQTIVRKGVNAGGAIHAINTKAKELYAGGNIRVINSIISETVFAARSIKATRSNATRFSAGCSITSNCSNANVFDASDSVNINCATKDIKKIFAGDKASIYDCKKIEKIKASRINLKNCELIGSIKSCSELRLYKSTVSGNIESPSSITIEESKVNGNLEICSKFSKIKKSFVDRILFKPVHSTNSIVSGDVNFIQSDGDSHIFSMGAHCSGDCNINGVSTRDLVRQQQECNKKEASIKQTLELDGSTVTDIVFESGTGEVILKNGAKVNGSVDGGTII